jgi:hypothetical protein
MVAGFLISGVRQSSPGNISPSCSGLDPFPQLEPLDWTIWHLAYSKPSLELIYQTKFSLSLSVQHTPCVWRFSDLASHDQRFSQAVIRS